MYSFAFPDFLSSTNVKLLKDHEATTSNIKLLLLSDKYGLFGDPYYGTSLKKLLFDQNSLVVQDLIIDDIFIAIQTFMPQVKINRKDIKVQADREHLNINIKALNLLDFKVDLYNIMLTNSEEI